jgi:catechol 2,3-dioxygenase-like lactoylglutathione lyase family enzyme
MDTENQRPAVWVGHIAIHTDVVAKSCEFMLDIGMRPIMQEEDFALFELRGGTHLVLLTDPNSTLLSGSFDLMVDDIDSTHARLVKLGYQPGEIERGNIHDSFEIRDPGGTMLTFNSSHVSDLPV